MAPGLAGRRLHAHGTVAGTNCTGGRGREAAPPVYGNDRATSVLDGDALYVPGSGVTKLKLTDKGVAEKPEWESRSVRPGMPSPRFIPVPAKTQ